MPRNTHIVTVHCRRHKRRAVGFAPAFWSSDITAVLRGLSTRQTGTGRVGGVLLRSIHTLDSARAHPTACRDRLGSHQNLDRTWQRVELCSILSRQRANAICRALPFGAGYLCKLRTTRNRSQNPMERCINNENYSPVLRFCRKLTLRLGLKIPGPLSCVCNYREPLFWTVQDEIVICLR